MLGALRFGITCARVEVTGGYWLPRANVQANICFVTLNIFPSNDTDETATRVNTGSTNSPYLWRNNVWTAVSETSSTNLFQAWLLWMISDLSWFKINVDYCRGFTGIGVEYSITRVRAFYIWNALHANANSYVCNIYSEIGYISNGLWL